MNLSDLSTSFKDTTGRTWLLHIDWAAMKRVRAATGIDLHGLVARPGPKMTKAEAAKLLDPLQEFLDDPYQILDVLWALLQPDAQRLGEGLSQEEFLAGFGDDTLDRAVMCLEKALLDFIRCPFRKEMLEGAILAAMRMKQGLQVVTRKVVAPKMAALRGMSEAEIEAKIDEALASENGPSTKLSTVSPESSASTPTPAP